MKRSKGGKGNVKDTEEDSEDGDGQKDERF
jgi:hypothetical protein